MREKILKNLAKWHSSHPWRMALVVLLLTVIFAAFAGRLSITMRTSDLLPERDPKVIQFNKIIDEFTTATSLIVVVQGEEKRIKEFADQLAPQILETKDTSSNDSLQRQVDKLQKKIEKLKEKGKESKIAELESEIKELQSQMNYKLFQRVDYKVDIDFLRNHMLMLVKEDDLKNMKDVFMDPNLIGLLTNLNNSMEKEYVGREESISTREKEDGAVSFLEGIQNLVLTLQKTTGAGEISDEEIEIAVDKLLFGEPYFLSYDKKALILNAIPNFTLMDRNFIMSSTVAVQSLVDNLLEDFPGIEAGLCGAIPKEHDEQVYSLSSLGYTTVIAFIAILLLLMVSFRMWVAPVFAIINLAFGVLWALGSAAIVVGQLNLVTSMLSVIVLGLGIDFSIHLISGFTERRAAGDTIEAAMERTFLKSGRGIVTGAITTACAFYALVISSSRAMKEMGLVMGTGLVAILLATMLCLPVMLVWRERLRDRRRERRKRAEKFVSRDISFRFLGRAGEWLSKNYAYSIAVSIVISALLIWSASKIHWDYDYRNMEPDVPSIWLLDTIMEKFDLSMDYALVLADDVSESYVLSEKYRELGSVALTEDISVFVPSEEQQQKRIPHINEVLEKIQSAPVKQAVLPGELSKLRDEIGRLEMNIMEMQDMAFIGGQDKVDNKCKDIVGDPENPNSKNIIQELLQMLDADVSTSARGFSNFQRNFGPYFKESVIKMSSTESIQLEELPVAILDRYSNKTRDQFLITVYPAGSIYDGEFLNKFAEDVERVSEKATGMPPLFVALLKIFGRDGRNAIILTLVVVFFLLWADFRKPAHALVAMIPLALGVFWMVGLMNLTGIQLSMMSVMGLPLIIGIGIDDGVHILHRWRSEGTGKIRIVFSSTGKAIFLTSLTTMFAFGSLLFSVFPAWGQFGGALFLGVAACFLTTVIILPGILGVVERVKSSDKKKKE
jgi:predicted RND superfamily exporter protein